MHVESLYVFGAKLFIGTFSNGVFVLDGPEGQIPVSYTHLDVYKRQYLVILVQKAKIALLLNLNTF